MLITSLSTDEQENSNFCYNPAEQHWELFLLPYLFSTLSIYTFFFIP